jgi:hypothetical protein
MSSAGIAAPLAARARLAIGHALATTPGRLQLAAALIVAGAVAVALVGSQAADTRRGAVRDVESTERLLVAAVELSTNLSDAHAAAAGSFLAGGPEPAVTRRRYVEKLRAAAAGVARLSREIGPSSPGQPQVRRITQTLLVYAGLVDEARASYRRGFPVGSAYLRLASTSLRDGPNAMLPSARELYGIEARKLTSSYETASSSWSVLAVVVPAGVLLLVLVGTQVFLARATQRILNPGLVLATAVLLGALAWPLVAFVRQDNALDEAQRSGSDPVELLTAARILAARADAEESITLSARGGGGGLTDLADADVGFQRIVAPIDGLLREAARVAGRPNDRIAAAYRAYSAAHGDVVEQVLIGEFSPASQLAVGPREDGRPSSKDAVAALNRVLDDEVDVAQRRFTATASRADSALGGLPTGIPLLAALCAMLGLAGLRRRLAEYR